MKKLKVQPNSIEYPIPLGIEKDGLNYYIDGHIDIFSKKYFKKNYTLYMRKYENCLLIYHLDYIVDNGNIIFSEKPLLKILKKHSKKVKKLVYEILDENFFDSNFDVIVFLEKNIYSNDCLLTNYNKYLFESFILELLEESYFFEGILEYNEKYSLNERFFFKVLEIYLNNQENLLEFIFKFKLFNSFNELLNNKISLSNFIIDKEKQKVCYSLLMFIKENMGIEILEEINSISMFSNDEIKLIEIFFSKCFKMFESMGCKPSKIFEFSIPEIFEILTHTKLVKQTLDYYVEQLFSKFWFIESVDFFKNYIDYLRIASYIQELDKEYTYSYFPKDVQSEHNKTSLKYTNLIKKDNEGYTIKEIKEFKSTVSKYINLEYSNDEYSVIVPKTISDVINEGDKLNHCVAGYVKLILDKKSQICFLRKNDNKEISYLTLEIKNNNIFQAKKFNNQLPNSEDIEFIKEWSNIKGLKIKQF